MEEHIHMEYETNLSQAFFRVTVAEPYTEDYQMPMLQRNPIDGILPIEGCGVNGAYVESGLSHAGTGVSFSESRKMVVLLFAGTKEKTVAVFS